MSVKVVPLLESLEMLRKLNLAEEQSVSDFIHKRYYNNVLRTIKEYQTHKNCRTDKCNQKGEITCKYRIEMDLEYGYETPNFKDWLFNRLFGEGGSA